MTRFFYGHREKYYTTILQAKPLQVYYIKDYFIKIFRDSIALLKLSIS